VQVCYCPKWSLLLACRLFSSTSSDFRFEVDIFILNCRIVQYDAEMHCIILFLYVHEVLGSDPEQGLTTLTTFRVSVSFIKAYPVPVRPGLLSYISSCYIRNYLIHLT